MKWRGRETSSNIEDRRGGKVAKAGGGIGVGFILLILASIFFPKAVPLLQMFGIGQPGQQQVTTTQGAGIQDDHREFISVTLRDTERVWEEAFQGNYREPTLVMFSGITNSPCGNASAQTGPFYCPADEKIYVDPAFFTVMERQLKARGDFAQAYVISHEVAHHVQKLTGALGRVNAERPRISKLEANKLTVRLELQADCYAGIWARRMHEKYGTLEDGDLDEALGAAHAVGDDVLQRMSGQRVDERQFTHGTAEQRKRWFTTGLNTSNPQACDTFSPGYNQL
ncbi:MAG: zinc metallopeptidase [Neomegalonema sp.]|nr:zinc metallopeptidase [Neomegalonema sp.]